MSPLAASLDIVAPIPEDYMHAVLEGVVRPLLSYWFNSAHHNQTYYIGRSVEKIEKLLLRQLSTF